MYARDIFSSSYCLIGHFNNRRSRLQMPGVNTLQFTDNNKTSAID
jgi:hypothetical protein